MDLFTRRYEIGLILDKKLSWRPNIEERVSKEAIEKRWGLSPKVVFWLYETVVNCVTEATRGGSFSALLLFQ